MKYLNVILTTIVILFYYQSVLKFNKHIRLIKYF